MAKQRIDLLLVNPPISLYELYGPLTRAGNTMPTTGLCYLGAMARKAGYRVRLLDAIAQGISFEKTLDLVTSCKPRYLGISSPTIALFSAAELAEVVKEHSPGIVIILGGAHITAVPEDTLRTFSQFDYGILGEGEISLCELIRGLDQGKNGSEIPGVICVRDGMFYQATERDRIADLDTLPYPAWDLLPGFPNDYSPPAHSFRQLPVAPMITSRGCPYKCIFCDRAVFGNRCRFHSANYILNMIEYLIERYKIKEILIYDDTLTLSKKRLTELCEGLIARNTPVSWTCFSRVDQVTKDILRLMRRAGCWQIGYGIESGSSDILKILNKGIDLDKVRSTVNWTRDVGIKTKGFFMIGSFGENKVTVRQTVDFALSLPLDDFQITNFTPFPGSEAFTLAGQYGDFDTDWRKMNMLKFCFVPEGMDVAALDRLQKEAYRRFYLQPKIVASNLGEVIKRPKNIRRLLRGGEAFTKLIFNKHHT